MTAAKKAVSKATAKKPPTICPELVATLGEIYDNGIPPQKATTRYTNNNYEVILRDPFTVVTSQGTYVIPRGATCLFYFDPRTKPTIHQLTCCTFFDYRVNHVQISLDKYGAAKVRSIQVHHRLSA